MRDKPVNTEHSSVLMGMRHQGEKNIYSKIKGIFLLILFFFGGQNLPGEPSTPAIENNKNVGLKYFKYYNPKIEDLQPQNWCILQDKRGIIYIANQGGVLELEGVSWHLIKIPNKSVRSMAIDDASTVYIGSKDEIGFLAPDARGSLQYVSLLDHINENQRNFAEVWKSHATPGGVYFHTLKFLFRWDSRQMKVWRAEGNYRFNASFTCQGKLFIRLHLSIGKKYLEPGEVTPLTVTFEGLEPDEGDLVFRLENKTPGIISMQGGNIRTYIIHAKDMKPDRKFSITLTLTGKIPGDFDIGTKVYPGLREHAGELGGAAGIKYRDEFTGLQEQEIVDMPESQYITYVKKELLKYKTGVDTSVTAEMKEWADEVLDFLNAANPGLQQWLADQYMKPLIKALSGEE